MNYIAVGFAIVTLWLCWWASDKVMNLLEGFDIRGEGVGFVWVFMGAPAIASAVYAWAETVF